MEIHKISITVKLFVLLLLLFSVNIFGQNKTDEKSPRFPDLQDDTLISRYRYSFGDTGTIISVRLWGEVGKPGVYEIPEGTSLIDLLSYAGGPTTRANLKKIKLVHSRLETDKINEPAQTITLDFQNYLTTGNAKLNPDLRNNATVIVPRKKFYGFFNGLNRTTQILSLISILLMIKYYITN